MSPSSGHILVVDDDDDLRSSYIRLLSGHGYTAEGAEDAIEALSRLSVSTFDAVLSDLHMPRAGGLDLLSGVRMRDLDVPIVLMTADPSLRTAIAAIEEGAVSYLTKPIHRGSLLPALEKAVRLGRLARAKREALALRGVDGHLVGDRAGLRVCFDRALSTLYPVFQPIVDVNAKSVIAYEALLRADEPLLPRPQEILAAAERLDRLAELGRRMRARVAEAAHTLPEATDLYVNLHPHDLLDDELYDRNAPLSRLASRTVLEITERATLDDITDVEGRVSRLRLLGYRLAVDDLGAGYAGLNSMVRLQPDVVKLDMTLVRGVDSDPARQRVVGALIDLSHRLEMKVICEGVETVGESEYLSLVDGNWQQGYLFARPDIVPPVVRWA